MWNNLVNKVKCLVYSHEWRFEKSIGYGGTEISKGRTGNNYSEGNLYKCQRCGKKDKV